jgi:hypothetical protein
MSLAPSDPHVELGRFEASHRVWNVIVHVGIDPFSSEISSDRFTRNDSGLCDSGTGDTLG